MDEYLTHPKSHLLIYDASCMVERIARGASRKMTRLHLGASFLKGLALTTVCISASVRTITPAGLPKRSRSTLRNPASSQVDFSSDIGSFPVPPTFTARIRAIYLVK